MCASYSCRPLSPFCLSRVGLGPSPKTAGSFFYRQIIYVTSRFVKVSRRLHWRLMTQVFVLIVFKNSEENPLNRRFCRWTHPRIGQRPCGRPLPVAMTGFPPRLGRDLVPGSGESTPGMGIDEAAEPMRIVAGPTGIGAGGSGDLGPAAGGRSHRGRSGRTIAPGGPYGRGMTPSRPGICGVAPRGGARAGRYRPRPGPPRPSAGPAGRDPTGTAPPPVGERSRAGTAAGMDERPGENRRRVRPAATTTGTGRVSDRGRPAASPRSAATAPAVAVRPDGSEAQVRRPCRVAGKPARDV